MSNFLKWFFGKKVETCPVCKCKVDMQNGYMNYFPSKVHSGKCSLIYLNKIKS